MIRRLLALLRPTLPASDTPLFDETVRECRADGWDLSELMSGGVS